LLQITSQRKPIVATATFLKGDVLAVLGKLPKAKYDLIVTSPPYNIGKDPGKPSGNPLGKNPSDYWEFSAEEYFNDDPVWDIPNVKANHPEKTIHPCQFPVELVERCVLAFTDPGDTVLDPFMGTGSTAIAAMMHNRNAVGIDKDGSFLKIARDRVKRLSKGTLQIRNSGKPTRKPRSGEKVAAVPEEWKSMQGRGDG